MVAAVRAGADAVVPGLPVADTVKRVDAEGAVVATVDRRRCARCRPRRASARAVLEAAHGVPDAGEATDDAGHVERPGGRVVVVPGAEEAFKVTRPLDLLLAEAVLARREADRG